MRRALGSSGGGPDGAFQRTELTASDGAAGDVFAYTAAVSGSTAVVSAPDKNSEQGAAYVFVRSGSGWSQQAKLTASDGASGDQFGSSVAIAGSTAVVSAPFRGASSGATYVFVRSGSTWSQQAELTASDGAAGDEFGSSVAIAGSTAVVGASGKNSNSGAAYVFERSGTTWSQRAELTASDGRSGDQFGHAVAISGSGSGSTAVVGAFAKNSSKGAAYVFVRSGTTWSQQAKLAAFDGASGDEFGYSVAISGSTVVLGAQGKNSEKGAAYMFVRSGTTWSRRAELTASDGASGDVFGHSVALYGSTVVVGAPFSNSQTGAAYVYMQSGTAWSQQTKLSASDGAAGDWFGWSVAVSGSNAVVGALNRNSATGAAYAFVFPSQQAELTASDGASGDLLGVSVAISASTAVVGAYGQNKGTGAAYVFVRSGSTWSLQAKLTASDAAARNLFGRSVAISGSTAVVGAYGRNRARGAAYVFVRSGSTWSQQAELIASHPIGDEDFGYSVAVDGSTAVVGAPGTISSAGASTGATYVFVHTSTGWHRRVELTLPDGAQNDQFGSSLAISDSTLVVGAYTANLFTGAAYVYVRSGSTWSQQAELAASGAGSGDQFGVSVAISGSTAVVGAYGKNSNTGEADVFVRSGSTWSQQAELTASDAAANDEFGYSLALSGSTLIVGAYGKNSTRGAAYVFVRSGTTWSQQATLTASDAAPKDMFGFSIALSGSSLVVGAHGKNSTSGAAYVFANL